VRSKFKTRVTPGDPAPSEARLRQLSEVDLAAEFVYAVKRMRVNGVSMTDAIRRDIYLQVVLTEFRRRLYERLADEAELHVVSHPRAV